MIVIQPIPFSSVSPADASPGHYNSCNHLFFSPYRPLTVREQQEEKNKNEENVNTEHILLYDEAWFNSLPASHSSFLFSYLSSSSLAHLIRPAPAGCPLFGPRAAIGDGIIDEPVSWTDYDHPAPLDVSHFPPSYLAMYDAFTYSYSYPHWYTQLRPLLRRPENTFVMRLTESQLNTLKRITRMRILQDRPIQCYMEDIKDAFTQYFPITPLPPAHDNNNHEDGPTPTQPHGQSESYFYSDFSVPPPSLWPWPLFAKLSLSSSKHDQTLRPINNIEELFAFLTNSKAFLREYEQPIHKPCLIIMPWDYTITKENEYRAFILDGRLTGVSQQHWACRVGLTGERMKRICQRVDAWTRQALFGRLPYRDVVIDLYVTDAVAQADTQTETDTHNEAAGQGSEANAIDDSGVYLIECNPCGIFMGGGSSLFHWIHDFKLLYNQQNIIYGRFVEDQQQTQEQAAEIEAKSE